MIGQSQLNHQLHLKENVLHVYQIAQHTGHYPYWLKDIATDTNMLNVKTQRQKMPKRHKISDTQTLQKYENLR